MDAFIYSSNNQNMSCRGAGHEYNGTYLALRLTTGTEKFYLADIGVVKRQRKTACSTGLGKGCSTPGLMELRKTQATNNSSRLWNYRDGLYS